MKISKAEMRKWWCVPVYDDVDDMPATRWKIAKQSARKRGKTFTLSQEFYLELISRPCDYCNMPLADEGMCLDRLDNGLDYCEENVIPCCGLCNLARNSAITPNEMYTFIGPAIRALRLHRENNKIPRDKGTLHNSGTD